MEYNSNVSMILPDSIDLIENDFDDEDIVHEQTNQNEIVELIMAAFQGHDELSDDEDSSNTSSSSHHSSDEQQILNINNNNNTDEQYVQQQNEVFHCNHSHQQTLFSTPPISTPSPLVPLTDIHGFEINDNDYTHEHNNNEENIPFNTKNHIVSYQNNNHSSTNTPITAVQYAPTIDPTQAQYFNHTSSINLNDTQNQLNKLYILCSAKDRKISQFENLCEEYREKYENDTRILKHKLELSEKLKHDWEQSYQLINTQHEQLIETNNQLHRTIKDTELRIQQLEAVKTQFEKKLSDSESLIDSLHRKINELHQFESIAYSQQNYELILSTTHEKHEEEIIFLNEKLENIQMNLQEKNVELDELRLQLEIANKNNEKCIVERMETIDHLNEQLHDYQRKYTDLLTTTSLESFNQTEIKRQLIHITEDKEKLEYKCQELQSEIRTLRERFDKNEHEVNNSLFTLTNIPINNNEKFLLNQSIINENIHLKERMEQLISNEKHLMELNEELQNKIQEFEYQHKRRDSSSSNSSHETVITISTYTDQIRNLKNEIEKFKKDYADLEEKYEYEKHELQTMIEQLREDVIELDKTKQLYINICQEKNSIEDILRSKFEFELKTKLDDLHEILEKEYNEKILFYINNQEKLQQNNQDLQQKLNELYQDIERIKIKHEKQIIELNNELDRLRTNDDAKNRLAYTEKEFEQLKHDYYNLNIKQKELLNTCSTLENDNQNFLNSIEQIEKENLYLKQTIQINEEKFLNEIKQLNQLNEHQKQELLSIHKQTDHNQINLKQNIQSLQLRIDNYENTIIQYEEYRIKLENNLQKLTQQRDINKNDLKLTKEMLTDKENEYHQLKLRFDQYETTINDLQRQIQELNQTRLTIIQETELKYHEKLISLDTEKCQYEQRLNEANQALDLADYHLQQEIEKIKLSLEQEYNHRYESDQKQHQHELYQLQQQLLSISSNNSHQDIEDIKKMYRTEIDRLYHENIQLSQHQTKLLDTHQKQMQIMKKELDDNYKNIINEFQHEQTHLQTRYDQLKQQLTNSQQTIEQLKSNLNQLKTNHFHDISKVKQAYTNEKYTNNRNRQDNLQNRLEYLVKLLEQSNDTLNQERTLHAKQENEYQQKISSLQKKISDMIKQHTKAIDEIKHQFQQQHLIKQKHITPRPISVPEFVESNLTTNNMKSDYISSFEKLRELFTNEIIAILRLTCKMIFDVHHRVVIAPFMDTLEISIKKQIQNELIRSRNSMIKEIRREIFEKMTHVLRSQGVPDTIIDMHVFELDRLLSQMAQDCLDSFTSSSSSNFSVLSLQITPQYQQNHSIIYNSSSSNKSTTRLRKSIECLYMTPTMNKQPTPISPPHDHITLDNNHRPKSASNLLIASQNSISSSIVPPHTHKYQRSTNKNFRMKMYKSEDDLIIAIQRNEQQTTNLDNNNNNDEENVLPLCKNEKEHQQSNVQILTKQFEEKSNYSQIKTQTSDIHNIIINNQQKKDDDELSWPLQPISTNPSTQTSGIKKFVRNSLKLFITQPQQHKRTGK